MEKREPISLWEAWAILMSIIDNPNEYTVVQESIKEFHPITIFSAIIDNDKYDPTNYSQEIEDSEKDNSKERREFEKSHYDVIWGWDSKKSKVHYDKLGNSKKWLDNHTKKFPYKFERIGLCASNVHEIKTPDNRIYKWRDYDSDFNREKFEKYFNEKESQGINIYEII